MTIRFHAVLAMCVAVLVTGPASADVVPVEVFAASSKIGSPRLSPDGRHVAMTTDLGEGNHALRVYRIEDMHQTALLRLPRYELPTQVTWVSDRRLVIAKGRQLGSREEPVPMGEIIASDLDGTQQKYIFGYEQANRMAGLERGFGYISGVPEVRNGRFYMRRLSRGSSRSQLYDVDAIKSTSRLVADVPAKDLSFTLDRAGVPRFAHGVDDDDHYLLYSADADGRNWAPVPAGQVGGKFVPLAFGADGRHVFAYHSVDGGPVTLVRALADGSGREILAQDAFASIHDAELAANSPTTLAARIKAPVLLVHGEIDERTPLAQARAMKSALEAAGNTPEWLVVPREGHGFHDDGNNAAFYRRLEAFMARHIGPARTSPGN